MSVSVRLPFGEKVARARLEALRDMVADVALAHDEVCGVEGCRDGARWIELVRMLNEMVVSHGGEDIFSDGEVRKH